MSPWVELAQAMSTWFLTGLIWTIQVVHYPLFARVGADTFVDYERAHVSKISLVVIPPMLLELATAIFWLAQPGGLGSDAERWVGAALLGIVWGSTFLLQVPEHDRLGRGLDRAAVRRLVRSNWVRTLAWTARAALLGAVLSRGLVDR